MYRILLRNKIKGCLRRREANGIHKEAYDLVISGTEINKIYDDWNLIDERLSGNKNEFQNNYLMRKVVWIEKRRRHKQSDNPIENVYNLEVEDDHSYIVNSVAVHNCVAYSRNNVLEFIHKRKYGVEKNWSDRFASVMSGTKPRQGNSLNSGAEGDRKFGKVLEEVYPSITPAMTEAEFFAYPPQAIRDKGLDFFKESLYGYEWTDRIGNKMSIEKAVQALKYSPLQTAIDSSTKKTSEFEGWNDAVVIYGYDYGKGWKVFGSYPQTTGWFEWDYPFFVPLRFELTNLTNLTNEDMKLKLVRNPQTGRIYLVDSDNKKHWINTPEAFVEYFGQRAWDEKDWIDVEPMTIDLLAEGEPIT